MYTLLKRYLQQVPVWVFIWSCKHSIWRCYQIKDDDSTWFFENMKLTHKNSMLKLSVENSPWIFKQFSIYWNSLKQSLIFSSCNFITSLQVYWKWIPLQVLFKFFFVPFIQDITWWLLPFCYLWNMQNVAKTIKQQKQSQWDDL